MNGLLDSNPHIVTGHFTALSESRKVKYEAREYEDHQDRENH